MSGVQGESHWEAVCTQIMFHGIEWNHKRDECRKEVVIWNSEIERMRIKERNLIVAASEIEPLKEECVKVSLGSTFELYTLILYYYMIYFQIKNWRDTVREWSTVLNVANRWKRGKLIQFKHQEWKGKKYKEICFMVEKCYSKVTTHTRFV